MSGCFTFHLNEVTMEWNIGALVTLGIAFAGSIVWIIRLEGKVKLLNETVNGSFGIHAVLQEIRVDMKSLNEKMSGFTERFGNVESDLKHLIKDHDRITSCGGHNNME